MRKIRFGKTELMVSELAFGGIPIQRHPREQAIEEIRKVLDMGVNFIDTAHGYTDSEEKIGEAIKAYPRESLVIASKSPAMDGDGFREHLELSLKRLGVEYIDIYQHHNVSSPEKMATVLGPDGAWKAMQKAMDEGLVRHPAFSAHSLETAKEMMLTRNYEATQIPFNFVDNAAEKELIPLARELDMGFICMKPLGGGLIDNARLCFRYLRQYPGIVPDPGIEHASEMEEIISIYSDESPLTDNEKSDIERIREELGASWCHRCEYCQPCPEGISISTVLTARSMTRRMPREKALSMLKGPVKKAESCSECGTCEERCPYDLPIRELLKTRRGQFSDFVETGIWT